MDNNFYKIEVKRKTHLIYTYTIILTLFLNNISFIIINF